MPRRRVLAGVVVLACAGLAAVLVPRGSATPRWDWIGGVPGAAHAPSALERALAERSGVETGSVRRVAAAGRLQLLAGRRGSDVCLAASTEALASDYECVSSLDRPLFLQTLTSGRDSVASYALVGAARNDVRSVEITLADGSTRALPLGRWRAFAFAASAPEPLPVSIAAYDDGGRIYTESVGAAAP